MKLIYQHTDGRRTEDAGEFHAYSLALKAVQIAFKGDGSMVAAYLQADRYAWNPAIPPRFVRTYTKTRTNYVDVANGYIPYPEPPVIFPGEFLFGPGTPIGWGDPRDDLVQLTARAYDLELAAADQKGYNRGFKVGISHRNRERAAQLRKQADSLERTASFLTPTGRLDYSPPLYPHQYAPAETPWALYRRMNTGYGGGRNQGKTWAGSVRDGVRNGDRPAFAFTVDLGHNRR